MNSKQQKLGDLATRFFAYVQLKRKETVATGELQDQLAISPAKERDLLRRLARSGWIVRLRRGLYLVPSRIPAGRYSPGVYLALQKLMEDCRGTYQICGPSAFSYYGFSEQITNTTYVYNNRISGERVIGSLRYVLIKVADTRLGGIDLFATPNGAQAVYSSEARTLVDAVYDWSRFNSLPRGYDWIRDFVSDRKKVQGLVDTTLSFGNQATLRRIGYLLQSLELPSRIVRRLKPALNPSKALIPLFPNKPQRGRVNREWGLIIND
jgi:predicted transcriptional regulator of viral defense system